MGSFVRGLERQMVRAKVKPAGYANSKMVKNLIVGQKLSDWEAITKFCEISGNELMKSNIDKYVTPEQFVQLVCEMGKE